MVKVVQALVNTGQPVTTARAGAVDLVSNPDQGSETTFTTFAGGAPGAAGTFPTNWKTTRGDRLRPELW